MEMGFIGLGAMGEPIARNLIKAGHALKIYNRTRSRAEALVGEGATLAETPARHATAGVVATMLADDAAVEGVVFGEHGILAGLPRGGVHISHSTISTNLSRRLTEAHRERGQFFVAAPVFGRPDAAQAARLIVVAAGPAGSGGALPPGAGGHRPQTLRDRPRPRRRQHRQTRGEFPDRVHAGDFGRSLCPLAKIRR